jgi:AAA domain-containing protein/Toprim domain-containing protein/CHC2-type zinc finger protein
LRDTVTLPEVLERLHARKNGSQWIAKCPAHEDKNPSLSITEKNGKILLCCHAGCSSEAVCEAMSLDIANLLTESGNDSGPRIVETYPYYDEEGNTLFEVVRFSPKSFRQRRPDGKGGWIWNLNGVRRVLYNLTGIESAESVVVTEGEKDVHSALKLGIFATCNPGGAGKWRDQYSETLFGKHCVIVADADEPGRKHAQQVAASLHLRARSVKVLELPGAKDLSEWMERGGTEKEFQTLAAAAPEWREPELNSKESVGSMSTAELFAVQDKKVDWLAWPFAATGLSFILDALPKVGKTRLLLEGMHASLTNQPFLNYATKPMRIVYISEQSAASLAMQCREVGFTGNEPVEKLRWITREHWSRYVFTDFLEKLEKDFLQRRGYNFLAFDCWHTIARLEDENAASEVNRLGNLTIDIATRNKLALTLGRHDRKSGGDVGVSGRSSIQLSGLVDVILHLVRVPSKPTQRKLELLGRVPGLPNEQIIDLVNGVYINFGEPVAPVMDRVAQVREMLNENPDLTAAQIVEKFAAMVPTVKVSLATAKRDRDRARAEADKKWKA